MIAEKDEPSCSGDGLIAWLGGEARPCWVMDGLGRLIHCPEGYSSERNFVTQDQVSWDPEQDVVPHEWEWTPERLTRRIVATRKMAPKTWSRVIDNSYPGLDIPSTDIWWYPRVRRPLPDTEAVAMIDRVESRKAASVRAYEALERMGISRVPYRGFLIEPLHRTRQDLQAGSQGLAYRVVHDGWLNNGRLLRPAILEPIVEPRGQIRA